MTKILIIACHFPPAGGVQVQRVLSLAKYLPGNGFDVHILTTRHPQVPHYDHGLLDRIPPSVTVHRTWSLEPPFHLRKRLWKVFAGLRPSSDSTGKPPASREGLGGIGAGLRKSVIRMLSPDPQVLWCPFASRVGASLIRRFGFKHVLVTAPPFSTFLIGNALKRRFPHISLTSELRDEWLGYFLDRFAFRDSSVARDAAEIEAETVRLSDRVVAVTPTTLRGLRARYPTEPPSKFHLVPNGFDPQAFESFRSRTPIGDTILVTFLGTVYRTSSPASYFEALDRLEPTLRGRFHTRFVGRVAEEMPASIFSGRAGQVTFTGFLPHRQAVSYMEDTDYLLLPWADHFNVPGKLYEYLATDKPILGLVRPQSDAALILSLGRNAFVADIDRPSEIAACLEKAAVTCSDLRNRRTGSESDRSRYGRPNLVARYAKVILDGQVPQWDFDSGRSAAASSPAK